MTDELRGLQKKKGQVGVAAMEDELFRREQRQEAERRAQPPQPRPELEQPERR